MVESRLQDAAVNAGVLSVYLTTILCINRQLFFDIERENFAVPFTCVSLTEMPATINLD